MEHRCLGKLMFSQICCFSCPSSPRRLRKSSTPPASLCLPFSSPAILSSSFLPTSALQCLPYSGPLIPPSAGLLELPCFPWVPTLSRVPVRQGHCCAATTALDPTRTGSPWAWRYRPRTPAWWRPRQEDQVTHLPPCCTASSTKGLSIW